METKFNTTDQYRVAGPAIYGREPSTSGKVSVGDVVTLLDPDIDSDGDLHTDGHGFIRASSLTPVAEEAPDGDIRITRTNLPQVVEKYGGFIVGGVYMESNEINDRAKENALRVLALAEYLEARESEAAAAEAKRDQRRNELATELVGEAYGESDFDCRYDRLSREMRVAVDHIIDLEAQVQA